MISQLNKEDKPAQYSVEDVERARREKEDLNWVPPTVITPPTPKVKPKTSGGDEVYLAGIKADPANVTITEVDSRRLRWLAQNTLTGNSSVLTKLLVYVVTNAALIATAFSVLVSEVELEHHAFVMTTDETAGAGPFGTFKQWAAFDAPYPALDGTESELQVLQPMADFACSLDASSAEAAASIKANRVSLALPLVFLTCCMLTVHSVRHALSDWKRCKRVAKGKDDVDTDPTGKAKAIRLEHLMALVGVALTMVAAALALGELLVVSTYSCDGIGLFAEVLLGLKKKNKKDKAGLLLFCVASVPSSTMASHAIAFAVLAAKVVSFGTASVAAIRYERLFTFSGKLSMSDLIATVLTPPDEYTEYYQRRLACVLRDESPKAQTKLGMAPAPYTKATPFIRDLFTQRAARLDEQPELKKEKAK
mmetsp:Transcript_21188/g.43406  ORF Transcript_21188/g.43406 Transcript_21188/m.43406 type:complete len:422 (-) Transcript_21188:265-1530(-)